MVLDLNGKLQYVQRAVLETQVVKPAYSSAIGYGELQRRVDKSVGTKLRLCAIYTVEHYRINQFKRSGMAHRLDIFSAGCSTRQQRCRQR